MGTSPQSITLRTLATRAGVSTAAVSNALNGKGRMSDETRERIRLMAQELGYRPNSQAASLRTGLSKIIGFVMTPDSDPDSERRWAAYSSHILYSLVLEAGKRGYSVTIISADHPELLANSYIDVLFYFDPVKDEKLIDEAQRLSIPVLSNDNFSDPRLSIVVDTGFAEMTRAAFTHLTEQGAHRPGLLTELPGIPSDEIAEKVYLQWCQENSIEPRIARGNYGRTDLTEQVDSLIEQGCDAIYSFYEEAEHILEILTSRGIRVPEDILLIAATTDDMESSRLNVSATVYHSDVAPAVAFDAMVTSAQRRENIQKIVTLPWELKISGSTENILSAT